MPILPKKPRSQKLEERAAAKNKKAAFYRQSNVDMANQATQLKSKREGMESTGRKAADKLIPKLEKASSKAGIKSVAVSQRAYNLKAKSDKLKAKGK